MNKEFVNIYNNLVNLSRNKSLFSIFTDKDTFSDRILILMFHFAFFLREFKDNTDKDYLQNFFDYFFRQIELSVREIGYGDVSINKRMKEYVNFMHSIINNIKLWEKLTLNQKLVFFNNHINLDKESSFYVDYFEKYTVYLSKKTFNYFTKDVISLNF